MKIEPMPEGTGALIARMAARDRKREWLKNFLEMCEAGDDIVGSTPKGLALRADLKRQIAALESSLNVGGQPRDEPATESTKKAP